VTTLLTTPDVEVRLDMITRHLEEIAAEVRWQRTQRESLQELLHDVSGLTGTSMGTLTERLVDLEQRGHLGFARSSLGVVDKVMTSFSEDDVEALGDNVVLILQTVKEMTQPEIMTMLQRTAHAVNEDAGASAETPSTLHLLRELRDPEIRRGLQRLLNLLRTMGEKPASEHPTSD
jgi:uncharacterized protein YjgD (DUF1641 family)